MPSRPTRRLPRSKPFAALTAIKLQRAWRRVLSHCTTHQLVQNNHATGMTPEYVRNISFEQLVVHLREKRVIDVGRACLQRIHILTTRRHGSPSPALVPEHVNVRVFLAAYMIVFRPTHVFESMGRLEKALKDAAAPLLDSFHKICMHIQKSKTHSFREVPAEMTKNFPTQLLHFLRSFKAWKVPDEQKLLLRIKHALVALYQSMSHLPFNEPEDSNISIEFRTQINRLRSKMEQIGGAAALKKFDEQRESGELHIPKSDARASSSLGAYASLPGRMSNEQLAHELLINLKFELGDDGEGGPVHKSSVAIGRIRENFHQAFWDSIVDDLKLEIPCYVRVLRILKEIHDGFNDHANARESGAINEIVDLDFIQQQVEAGHYDFASFKSLIANVVGVVRSIQAPKRDAETTAKWEAVQREMDTAAADGQPRAIANSLEFLLNRLNAIRIDAANARLRLIAPTIKEHGVDYERSKFQEKLDNGTLTLERTTAWIHQAVKEQPEAALGGLASGQCSAYMDVHTDAMVSLVTSPAPIHSDTIAETLLFDVAHLAHLQQEFDYVTSAAAMLLTVADRARPTQAVMEGVGKLFLDENELEMDVADMVEKVGNELGDASPEARQQVRQTLPGCANPANPVKLLMRNRLKQVIRTAVRSGNITITGAPRLLTPRIEKMAARLANISKINRDVHIPTYNKLIREATRAIKPQ